MEIEQFVDREPTVLCYGAGVDSTSEAVRRVAAGLPLDLILFSNTIAEKPHTYAYKEMFSRWLVERGYSAIVEVRNENETLENMCHRLGTLPSKTVGYKTCSSRFKTEPQDKYLNNWPIARAIWNSGRRITKLICYNADESHRVKDYSDNKYLVQFPLVENGIGREAAKQIILSAGLPVPRKSACFFCPSSKKAEILQLAAEYPDLAARAVAMERNNIKMRVPGLGRHFSWGELIASDAKRREEIQETIVEQDCACYDGEED